MPHADCERRAYNQPTILFDGSSLPDAGAAFWRSGGPNPMLAAINYKSMLSPHVVQGLVPNHVTTPPPLHPSRLYNQQPALHVGANIQLRPSSLVWSCTTMLTMVQNISFSAALILFGFISSCATITQEEIDTIVNFHNKLRNDVSPPADAMLKLVRPLKVYFTCLIKNHW